MASAADNMEEWTQILLKHLQLDVSEACKLNVLECLIYRESQMQNSAKDSFEKWIDYMGRRII